MKIDTIAEIIESAIDFLISIAIGAAIPIGAMIFVHYGGFPAHWTLGVGGVVAWNLIGAMIG